MKFDREDKNGKLVSLCYDFALIIHGDPKKSVDALASAVALVNERLGKPFRWFSTGNAKSKSPTDSDTVNHLLNDLAAHDFKKNAIFGFRLHSGTGSKDAHTPAIDLQCDAIGKDKHSIIRFAFPNADIKAIYGLILELAELIPFSWGLAGYGLYYDVMDTTRRKKFFNEYPGWLKRFQGLIHADFADYAMVSFKGVADVNWLTFIGASNAGAIGADTDATYPNVLRFSHGGLLLQADEVPILGDINRRESLEKYQAVGALVSPISITSRQANNVWIDGLSEDDMGPWLRRFF